MIGPRTREQLSDNLQALDVTLRDEELNQMDRIVPPGKAVVSFYEADFGPNEFC